MGKRSSINNLIPVHYKVQSKLSSEPISMFYKVQSKFSSEPIKCFYELGKKSSIPVRVNYKLDSDVGKRTSKKIRCFYELISNSYFPSMVPNSDNEPSSEPTAGEFKGHMRFRASIVCPDLGTEYEIPPEHLLGPLEITDGNNSPVNWGFKLLNHQLQYTKPSGDFQDLITEGYISYQRNTTKFVKIQVLSICGEEWELETFPQLVIKKVAPGARGDMVLSLSGTDFLSESLYQSKDWPSYVVEVPCERMRPDELPAWEANKEYKIGDVIQPPSEWSWKYYKTKTIGGETDSSPQDAPKLWNIPTTFIPFIQSSLGRIKITAGLKFTQDGVRMYVYPRDYTKLSQEIDFFEALFDGTVEPETYNGQTVVFYSEWAYPRETSSAFRCIQAGTSGVISPEWKPFSLDYQKDADGRYNQFAWMNENIEGEVLKDGNLSGGKNWGLNPPNLLSSDITDDGTCKWEAISNETEPRYMATDLTKKEYNRYLGSQVYVNWTEKFPPEDFIPDATAEILKFTEYFSPEFSVNYINPFSMKWLIQDVIQKSIDDAFGYSKIEKPKFHLRMDFQDFLIYNNIQVQGKQAINLLTLALNAFGGQFNITSYDGETLTFHVTLTPLYTEIKDCRADFVIPEALLRDCKPVDKNFKRINTINVIKPGKVREVRTLV